MNNNLNLEYNIFAICPYCGYEHKDSWEYNLSDGESIITECHNCDKSFLIGCDIIITYSTEKYNG